MFFGSYVRSFYKDMNRLIRYDLLCFWFLFQVLLKDMNRLRQHLTGYVFGSPFNP